MKTKIATLLLLSIFMAIAHGAPYQLPVKCKFNNGSKKIYVGFTDYFPTDLKGEKIEITVGVNHRLLTSQIYKLKKILNLRAGSTYFFEKMGYSTGGNRKFPKKVSVTKNYWVNHYQKMLSLDDDIFPLNCDY